MILSVVAAYLLRMFRFPRLPGKKQINYTGDRNILVIPFDLLCIQLGFFASSPSLRFWSQFAKPEDGEETVAAGKRHSSLWYFIV